jgi:DNA-directed RNA polymerase subunit F
VKVIARTASGPCLPYITRIGADAQAIREVMNQALKDLPDVSAVLAIAEVLPANEADYQVLLEYERAAMQMGITDL